jgi:hypothetical protein
LCECVVRVSTLIALTVLVMLGLMLPYPESDGQIFRHLPSL